VLGVDNVFVPVGDLARAVEFYRDVVGLPVAKRFEDMGMALFRIGDETPGLGVGVTDAPRVGGQKVWFEVPDARAAADELSAARVARYSCQRQSWSGLCAASLAAPPTSRQIPRVAAGEIEERPPDRGRQLASTAGGVRRGDVRHREPRSYRWRIGATPVKIVNGGRRTQHAARGSCRWACDRAWFRRPGAGRFQDFLVAGTMVA
jgi:catechol 2,3-dioxygenase-like lactoylglutathione lyase family enzyme